MKVVCVDQNTLHSVASGKTVTRISKLQLVDLAGSERLDSVKTGLRMIKALVDVN